MYELSMQVKDEHIDFQGIVDGLYYPFYFEECRHKYVKEAVGVDIQEFAQRGLNLVLAEYHLKFRASLKKGDRLVELDISRTVVMHVFVYQCAGIDDTLRRNRWLDTTIHCSVCRTSFPV